MKMKNFFLVDDSYRTVCFRVDLNVYSLAVWGANGIQPIITTSFYAVHRVRRSTISDVLTTLGATGIPYLRQLAEDLLKV